MTTGLDFDLPTEAQWEFAARAGNGDTKWGDGSGILNTSPDANLELLGRYKQNGGQFWNGTEFAYPARSVGVTNGTAIVGSYAPNDWGLYDTFGNVSEWCLDWYEENIATAKDASGNEYGGRVNIDPSAPSNTLSSVPTAGTKRVRRNGAWKDDAVASRPAFRGGEEPSFQSSNVGFRLVCTAGLQ